MWMEIALIVVVGVVIKRLFKTDHSHKLIQEAAARGEVIQPYSAIPGPKGWPLIGTVLEVMKYGENFFEMQLDRAKYGRISKETIFGQDLLIIFGADVIEELSKKDGKYPHLFELELWKDYKKRNGYEKGILTR